MQYSDLPTRIQVPFAQSGPKNVVPVPSQVSITPGAASFTTGFPPLTMTPIAAGGVPPFGQDMNGVLFDATGWARWQAAGGMVAYDAAFSAAVGGYPKGATLAAASGVGMWLSTDENNTTNPDAGGAGWVAVMSGRLLDLRFFTASTTYTPTPGTVFIIVEAIGGGGAGGGIAATGGGAAGAGSGGGAGSYGMLWLPAGVTNQTVTIGAGGAGVSGANGGNGGVTSFGALMSCPGGLGGLGGPGRSAAGVSAQAVAGGTTPSGASHGNGGSPSGSSIVLSASSALSGAGAPTRFGGGGTPAGLNATSGIAGNPGGGFGTGGSGACAVASGSGFKGGDGAPGLVIVWEYS